LGDRAVTIWTRGETPVFTDHRGSLTLVPLDSVPFTPVRTYVLHGIPRKGTRGGHASRTQQRLLVGISGCARVMLDDGVTESTVELAGGDTLLIGPAIWFEIEARDDDVAILVFADGDYDPSDYLSDRSELPLSSATAAETTRD
jgi:UDP-2-acetamido-3-amino-2,3-dideoxy-glucuronate N-acetyltransferase